MAEQMFPALPEDLGSLSVEELQERIAEYQALLPRVRDKDPELVGERTYQQILDEVKGAVAFITALATEIQERATADVDFDGEFEKLVNEIPEVKAEDKDEPAEEAKDEPEDPPKDEPAEPAPAPEKETNVTVNEAETVELTVEPEPVVEETREPVLAAAPRLTRKPPIPRVPARNEPIERASKRGFVASSGIQDIAPGKALDKRGVAEAIIAARYAQVATPAGFRDKVTVARLDYRDMFPDERTLTGDSLLDKAKVDQVTDPQAIIASGGLCAPLTPRYEIDTISVADRPVRDALPSFAATRGGITLTPGLSLSAADDAVGLKTAAQDEAGGTTAAKTCLVIPCEPFEDYALSMIYRCLEFGNLGSRAWPEIVETFTELASAAHARLAETALLDGIKAASTAVTQAAVYGAVSSLITAIGYAGAGMRSRHRMAANSRLRVLMPTWVADLAAADLANSQFVRFEYARADIERLLERYNINVSWYLDGSTTGGQVFGAQDAGALVDFPNTVEWFIFPEGSFLFLDGGTLDLGTVRDSTLNLQNDLQIFMETFEQVAFTGVESLAVTSTVCPTGTTGPTATAITC